MKKTSSYILNTIIALSFVVAAIFWMLSELPDTRGTFGAFTFDWAVVVATSVTALILIIKGICLVDEPSYKRVYIIVGCIFAIVTVISLVSALALPQEAVLPTIAVVVACAVVLAIIFATFGRNWDAGDNHKEGYVTYAQRKDQLLQDIGQSVLISQPVSAYNQPKLDEATKHELESNKTKVELISNN
ncbi:MAG: hypothetical protein LBK70_01415 [Clostridiales bacterium]|jgi:choline-glycine betaine transporter|nr:hypothetical protein [Clostridiales bacterium]